MFYQSFEDMQTIDRLRDKIKKDRLSVLTVSKNTGISAYKIYKWLDGKGSPKHEDSLILDKWLRNQLEEPLKNGEQVSVTTSGKEQLKDVLQTKAMVKTLLQELAWVKAQLTGRDKMEVLEEFHQKTMNNLLSLTDQSAP